MALLYKMVQVDTRLFQVAVVEKKMSRLGI